MTARPLCRYCGGPIPKRTTDVFVREPGEIGSIVTATVHGPLYSKADCQRTSNKQVVSLRYSSISDYQREEHRLRGTKPPTRRVMSFSTWDGVSYTDEHFCKGVCATRFAYVMAREGHCTVAYKNAEKRQRENAA